MKRTALAVAILLATMPTSFAANRYASNMQTISKPHGCPATKFCGCGLARYWGIWKPELNKVSNWPQHFARADGPAVGRAGVRRDGHHVLGIVGGGPGAWEVVDFNSGGHQSHRYVTHSFPGYYFLNVRA